MSPEELLPLLDGLDKAAEIVEAIDTPQLQIQRGWDLSCWRYRLVPWGVCFSYRDPLTADQPDVCILLAAGRSPSITYARVGHG